MNPSMNTSSVHINNKLDFSIARLFRKFKTNLMKIFVVLSFLMAAIIVYVIHVKNQPIITSENFKRNRNDFDSDTTPKSLYNSTYIEITTSTRVKTNGHSKFVVPEPSISCPGEVCYGVPGDAGKWVCSPANAKDDCIIYSLGVGGDTLFETSIYKATNGRCQIFCFDKNLQNPSLFTSFQGTFKNWNIANKSDPSTNQYTFTDLLTTFKHRDIEFLKIDIEGTEFDILPDILRLTSGKNPKVKTCQLFVEVHYKMTNDSEAAERLQTAFDESDFRMFHKEVNPGCPTCFEFSYLNKHCFEQYEVKE